MNCIIINELYYYYTITSATNSRQVSLELHVPFEYFFIQRLLAFWLWRIHHVYVVWWPCPLITSTYALLSSNLYAYLQLYIQSFRFSSLHLSFVFSFFIEQDGYEVKVAFLSNRFENPLEDIVFLDGIQLKTQNTIFNNFENCSVGWEIKLPHMRRRVSKPFN